MTQIIIAIERGTGEDFICFEVVEPDSPLLKERRFAEKIVEENKYFDGNPTTVYRGYVGEKIVFEIFHNNALTIFYSKEETK